MKKKLTDFVQSLGGQCYYSGKWPAALYVSGSKAEEIITALYQRFGRHTQVRFVHSENLN